MYGGDPVPAKAETTSKKTKRPDADDGGRVSKVRKIEHSVLPANLNAGTIKWVNRQAEYVVGTVMADRDPASEPDPGIGPDADAVFELDVDLDPGDVVGSQTVIDTLRKLRDEDVEIVRPLGVVDPRKVVTAGTLPFVAVKRGVAGVRDNEEMKQPLLGVNGKWTESGYASGAKSKANQRHLQLLSQLSQLLISSVTSTEEIEAMVINGRIFVSANEQSTVKELHALDLPARLSAAKSTRLLEDMDFESRRPRKIADLVAALVLPSGTDPAGVTDLGAAAGINRLTQLETDCAIVGSQRESVTGILRTLYETVTGRRPLVNGGSPEDAAKLVNDPGHAGRIIVVDAWDMVKDGKTTPLSHAEQNLTYTAVLSGFTGQVAIAGGKRPCTVCWMTMSLARACNLDVRYNPNAGGFWDGTTFKGLWRVAVALGFTDEEYLSTTLFKLCEGNHGLIQHVTDLVDGAPETKRIKLFQAIKRRRHATGTSSPSQSQEYPPAPPSPPAPRQLAVELEPAELSLSQDSTEETSRVILTDEPVSFGGGDSGTVTVVEEAPPTVATAQSTEDGVLLSVFTTDVQILRRSAAAAVPAVARRTYDLVEGDAFMIGSLTWRIVAV